MASSHASTETDSTTEQIEPLFPDLEEMKQEADEWRIEWSDGSSRKTTITAMAWYAQEFDPEATVTPL